MLFNPLKGNVVEYILSLMGDLQGQMSAHSAVPSNASNTGTPLDQIIAGLGQASDTEAARMHGDDFSSLIPLIQQAYQNGDYRAIQGYLASLPSYIQMNPEWTKWVDNMIAQQNTGEAREWEDTQSSTNLLKAGSQLEQLGLSASGVLQTGGSNVNGVAAASNSMGNLAQQNKLARYNQKMAMARQILSMTSQMASAGIYGSAIGAARHAAGVVTSNAAHSAYGALSGIGKPEKMTKTRDQILAELANPDESQY